MVHWAGLPAPETPPCSPLPTSASQAAHPPGSMRARGWPMPGAQRFPSLHRPLVVCLDPQPGHRGPCSLLTAAFTPGVFAGGRAAQGSPDGSRGRCLRPQPHGLAPLEWLGVQVVAFLHFGLQGPHCEPAKAARPVWSLRVRNQCRAGAISAAESTFPGNTGSAWPALCTIHTAASYT